MLILMRKIGEEITIRDDIRVKVIDIEGGRVRLGFEAPTEISIHRKELHEVLRRQGKKHTDSHARGISMTEEE